MKQEGYCSLQSTCILQGFQINYKEKDKAQNLALPLNKCVIQTGYKDEAPGYSHLGAGQRHYGTDMTSAAGITHFMLAVMAS